MWCSHVLYIEKRESLAVYGLDIWSRLWVLYSLKHRESFVCLVLMPNYKRTPKKKRPITYNNNSFPHVRHMSELWDDCFIVLYHSRLDFAHADSAPAVLCCYCPYEQLTPTSLSGLSSASWCNPIFSNLLSCHSSASLFYFHTMIACNNAIKMKWWPKVTNNPG